MKPTQQQELIKEFHDYSLWLAEQNAAGNIKMKEVESMIATWWMRKMEELAQAYGGCTNCYGKGYATVMQRGAGRGEADMGNADVVMDIALNPTVTCVCARGQELEKLLGNQ